MDSTRFDNVSHLPPLHIRRVSKDRNEKWRKPVEYSVSPWGRIVTFHIGFLLAIAGFIIVGGSEAWKPLGVALVGTGMIPVASAIFDFTLLGLFYEGITKGPEIRHRSLTRIDSDLKDVVDDHAA